MNRGSATWSAAAGTNTTGFNEAPIHESGKFQDLQGTLFTPVASMRPRFMNRGSLTRSRSWCPTSLRFNEAPIHESGKWGVLLVDAVLDVSASMRPRFMNRGSDGRLMFRELRFPALQ